MARARVTIVRAEGGRRNEAVAIEEAGREARKGGEEKAAGDVKHGKGSIPVGDRIRNHGHDQGQGFGVFAVRGCGNEAGEDRI